MLSKMTIASSTILPIATINPEMVRIFKVMPMDLRIPDVAKSEMGRDTAISKVDRTFRKKNHTHSMENTQPNSLRTRPFKDELRSCARSNIRSKEYIAVFYRSNLRSPVFHFLGYFCDVSRRRFYDIN